MHAAGERNVWCSRDRLSSYWVGIKWNSEINEGELPKMAANDVPGVRGTRSWPALVVFTCFSRVPRSIPVSSKTPGRVPYTSLRSPSSHMFLMGSRECALLRPSAVKTSAPQSDHCLSRANFDLPFFLFVLRFAIDFPLLRSCDYKDPILLGPRVALRSVKNWCNCLLHRWWFPFVTVRENGRRGREPNLLGNLSSAL